MIKKGLIYFCLLMMMSITSIGTVNFSCQSTVNPVEAQFTADCALKTLRTVAKYTGSSDRYTYITRIVDGSGKTLTSCSVHAGKKRDECTYSSNYYYYSTPHTHNYTRYTN